MTYSVEGDRVSIAAVAARLRRVLEVLPAGDANRHFISTYLRTTLAVADALREDIFEDAAWVERWDVAFAELYLDAIEAEQSGGTPSAPWEVAFATAEARPDLPPLRHVLLGINAHINFDLPQALLAVMSDEDFADPHVRARRARDHEAIDAVLSERVGAEDAELAAATGRRGMLDRLLSPFNQIGTNRFLKEAREKVWMNALELSRARHEGDVALKARLDELSALSAAKLEQLTAPGQVLLKLAATGFGVRLSPELPCVARNGATPARHRSFDPRRVGRLERDAWVAYYEHRWLRLLIVSVALVRAGFRLGPFATLRGAWHVLRANQLWGPVPDNDADGARRHMARFYRIVRERGGEPIDPEVAARLEVEWWRIHRALQRDGGARATEAQLVAALSDLYAYAYSVDRAAVLLAARERAGAMVLSDRWVAEGCPSGSPHLAAEGAALVRSYAALLGAVHR